MGVVPNESPADLAVSWSFGKGVKLLTEQQIARSFRKLFTKGGYTDEAFEKADALLEELRPESPLRHRLGAELEELRRLRFQVQE